MDIVSNLKLDNPIRFSQSFNRQNLHYYVYPKTKNVMIDIITFIQGRYSGKSGIIYCTSKRECETMSSKLNVCFARVISRPD